MIDSIKHTDFQTKEDFLFYLQNNLGCNDLKVAYTYKKDGEIMFSRWVSYLYLQHFEQDEYIPLVFMTRREFTKKVSHRNVLDIEIMLDIDDMGRYKSIKNKAARICRKLKKANVKFSCYFTGNKSYHISILMPEFRDYSENDKKAVKYGIINMLGCDVLKSSSNILIALEGEVHYKSNIRKIEVNLI